MLHPGLYEQVITSALNSELSTIPEARKAIAPIDKAEASKVLAQYLADVVQKALDNVIDNGGDISAQIALTNQIVDLIQTTTEEADFASMGVAQRAEQLLSLLRENDPRLLLGKTAADMERPETSVAQSSLFTGAIHEPQMFSELKKEINSADQIEMLVSFIKSSFSMKAGLISRISTFEEDSGLPLTLANFADYYRLDIRTIYAKNSFSRLCVAAGVKEDFDEPVETALTKAFGRVAAIDSRRWVRFLLGILPRLDDVDFGKLSPIEQRMLQMFYITIWVKAAEDWGSDEVLDNLHSLSDSPVMLAELMELLQYKYDLIDFIDAPVDLGFDCPLDLHCTYTRDQLLVALDFMNPNSVREGVKWLPDKQVDVLFVTLNKSDKEYSPTTMYNDYSINEELFHWQSQSTTTDTGSVGQRYIHHRERGSKVLLFVREFKSDLVGAAPYTFLGTANYVKHTGNRPMNITWKLDHPIPSKYLKKTQKLVVG